MTMPDGKHLENRYDAEYLRAGTVENGTVTTFSYHNGELLAESSPEGDTISRYIPGYGVAVGWNREKSGYHYYHLDEQNSTAYITGNSGEIENRYEYDAFGVLQNSMEEFHNRILYTGQQYDQTSGQYYLRARFYNPVLGRFVQEDEYRGDGLNLYAYCKNNPVVYYDPSGYGEEKCDKVGGNDSKSGTSSTTAGFDDWLGKGATDNKVYFGMKDGTAQYTGITKQTKNARLNQHNNAGKGFDDLDIQYEGLTRNQARAIEQYYIENGPNALNKINSISPNNKYYQDAMNWAKQYLGVE